MALHRSEFQNPERAGHAQTFTAGEIHALAIIHKQQVGLERRRETEHRYFRNNFVISTGAQRSGEICGLL
jgi:hypothetical protein